jgi:HK97 family phage major capsid protein
MEFKTKTIAEQEAMTNEELQAYKTAEKAHEKSQILEEAKAEAKKEVDAQKARIDELEGQLVDLSASKTKEEIKDAVVLALKENDEEIKSFLKSKSGKLEITVKASQAPADIADRDNYAIHLGGTIRKPFRRFNILELFRRVPVSKEYVKYREENTVTRDAKVVVACAASTHNTKKTWVDRTVQITKIRDFVDVCVDMMDDYDFVGAEIRQLVEQSLKAKEESEILAGTGTNPTDILSIDIIASEFDPANVLAPYTEAFQAPTIGDLTSAMKAQIVTFGQENAWMPDTIVMNYNDKIKYLHSKDLDNNYLFPNFVFGTTNQINEMEIVTSPLVAPNTLYVFDSTKGQILDRQQMTVEFAYENRANFETETVTVKAVERLQFHVPIIERDAFMKCTDIAQAITDITTPTT